MVKSRSGFTIVELLIVVVVIAILAAISIVAYASIQERANSAAIQVDLNNLSKKAAEFRVLNGHFPVDANELVSLGLKVSKNAYDTNRTLNFSYCIIPGGTGFAVGGISKSGRRFFVSSAVGVTEYPSNTVNDGNESAANSNCTNLLSGSVRLSAGYYSADPNGWRSWTGN